MPAARGRTTPARPATSGAAEYDADQAREVSRSANGPWWFCFSRDTMNREIRLVSDELLLCGRQERSASGPTQPGSARWHSQLLPKQQFFPQPAQYACCPRNGFTSPRIAAGRDPHRSWWPALLLTDRVDHDGSLESNRGTGSGRPLRPGTAWNNSRKIWSGHLPRRRAMCGWPVTVLPDTGRSGSGARRRRAPQGKPGTYHPRHPQSWSLGWEDARFGVAGVWLRVFHHQGRIRMQAPPNSRLRSPSATRSSARTSRPSAAAEQHYLLFPSGRCAARKPPAVRPAFRIRL